MTLFNHNHTTLKAQLEKLQKDLDALQRDLGVGEGERDKETHDKGEKSANESAKEGDDKGQEKKDDKSDEKKQPKPKLKERWKKLNLPKKIALVGVVAFVAFASILFAYLQWKYENTDDAYVQAYSTQIAPKVAGIVTHVLVIENQGVHAGQILMQIDRKDYEAELADAIASRGSVQAQYLNAERDYRRMKLLIADQAISPQDFDRAGANYRNLDKQMRAADARVEEARLNLEYTSVRAPSDGTIARRSIDVGMYAAAGTAVLGFIPNDERWVDANFKETQLTRIAPGRPAKVKVDAIKGKTFEGVVESVSPATGATFTLLPPDNATGNFTKVVQRVPVRIRLKNLGPDDLAALQAGLSAEVDVYKHRDLEELPPASQPVYAYEAITTPEPPLTINGKEEAGIVDDQAKMSDDDESLDPPAE